MPTDHYVTITTPDNKPVRARVIYLQPRAERWRAQAAQVHILCSEWIQPYWHPASYSVGAQSFTGQYMPHAYELGDPQGYLFKGTFERTQ